jgi:predicted acetyltransferase
MVFILLRSVAGMGLRLVEPSLEYQAAYLGMVEEWRKVESKLVPYVLMLGTDDFPAMLEKLANQKSGVGLPEDFVEQSTYWLLDEKMERLLGAVNIRHRLNESLMLRGGHIGYGIRPGERRKGYATRMLAMALDIARNMGLSKVLVTCDKINVGSARTIMNNGGVLDSEWSEPAGNVIQRYWIELS